MDTKNLSEALSEEFSDIAFISSNKTYWSPSNKTIFFNKNDKKLDFSLLHETGHMLCGHKNYNFDVELLIMESEAWEKAIEISKRYNIKIDNDYVQDCLDSYRNWLHKRSLCPKCDINSSQVNKSTYKCLNCGLEWKVASSRFCRSYRMKQKSPE